MDIDQCSKYIYWIFQHIQLSSNNTVVTKNNYYRSLIEFKKLFSTLQNIIDLFDDYMAGINPFTIIRGHW